MPNAYLVTINGHQYVRYGLPVAVVPADKASIAVKFNPHHDPRTGEFAHGSGGSLGPGAVEAPTGRSSAIDKVTGRIHSGVPGDKGKKHITAVKGAVEYLGSDAEGLLKASKITIEPKPGPSAASLAGYSKSTGQIRIYPKTFASKMESHPVMLAATLYHEARHAAQPDSMSVKEREREATASTLAWARKRLETEKNPAYAGALQRVIANEEWYAKQF